MADTAIAITAGTGTNIDTRTEGTNGNHRQVVVLGDPATNAGVAPVDATAGLKVDLGADNDITGTVTANLGATDNAVLDAIEADTTTLAGAVAGTEMQVDIVTSALPSGAATSAKQDTLIGHVDGIETQLTTLAGYVDGLETLIGTTNTNTGAAATALGIMDDWDNGASDGASVSGDVAHDTADAGEPVKIGGKALNLGANPTGVTANDRVNGMFTRAGQQITLGGHVNIITKNLNVTDADGAQTNADVLGAIDSNVSVVVTKVSVMADGANTGDVAVRLGFGTASVPAADSAGILFAHPGIKPGSGVVEGNGAGILGIGASGEELRVTCEDPAGGAIDITISYFTIEI